MASGIGDPEITAMIRHHHERLDGRGYPDGLAGEDIPLGARIIAVSDAFDAMVADRPYCAGIPADEALAELRRCAGGQFDPAVVTAVLAALDRGVGAKHGPASPALALT